MFTERQALPALARTAIEVALDARPAGGGPQLAGTDDADWLQVKAASFVTLTQQGQLRGCMGTLAAHRPLIEDVQHNAVSAALHDPRFAPLNAAELCRTAVEVSVLSAPEALPFDCEADALARLRPGVDGIVLEYGRLRSTFLPQVWEQLPRASDFLFQLKRKAGLPGDFWHDSLRLQRYTVDKYLETA